MISGAGLAPVEGVVELGDDLLGLLGAERAEDGVDLLLEPLVALAGLRRAHMQKERQARDLPDELQRNSDCQFSSVSRPTSRR